MRILNYPPSNGDLLSWKYLLSPDQAIGFPIQTRELPNIDLDNATIASRLDEACEVFHGVFLEQLNRSTIPPGTDIQVLYESLEKLSVMQRQILVYSATAAMEYIKVTVPASSSTKKYLIIQQKEFIESIQPISYYQKFFKELKEQNSEAKIQTGFKGAVHCEVGPHQSPSS